MGSSYPTFISKNLSWHKPTWQSSTLHGQSSAFAVDGEKDTHSYTKNGVNSWEVDLESVAIITNIKIFQKWPGDKLWIDVRDPNDNLVQRKDWNVENPPNDFEFYFDSVMGQKVRISCRENCYLSLSEIEVYGKYLIEPPTLSPTMRPTAISSLVPSIEPSFIPSTSNSPTSSSYPTFISKNLSWHKPTWQSSTLHGQSSAFAVDGEKDTHSYTKNGVNSWEVDLESVAIITNIKIFQKWPGDKLWIDVRVLMIIWYKGKIGMWKIHQTILNFTLTQLWVKRCASLVEKIVI